MIPIGIYMPETSIIIRAFNEAKYIGDVLEAVENQEYQDFEIILVDSGSTDGTLEIADEYVDTIEFVSPQNFTFGYSCNVGCEVASGDYCSFLSAHAIPTNNQWLGTMVENLYDDEVAMTYSNQTGAQTTKFSERRLFNELFPNESRRQRPPNYWANNASSAFKRSLWEEHSFDEHLTGHEDIEWAKHFMDKGYTVVYEADACIYHIHDESWEQVFNRFEREAIADVEIGIKSPSDRWEEYLSIPQDILRDTLATIKQGKINVGRINEIIKFRYNQHMGTASGLITERDIGESRYDYFYSQANESIWVREDGSVSIKQSSLPNLRPGEVLIRNEYVGVDPDVGLAADATEYPIIPVGNYVGTVADLGPNVNSVEIGEQVIGGTKFHCGVCSACSKGEYQNCENPTRLGIDTSQGAFSRFIPVPSDYVYPLPKDINSRKGTLIRPVMQIKAELSRIQRMIDTPGNCLVVGATPKGKLVRQVINSTSEYSATQMDEGALRSSGNSPDLTEYDLLVEATGNSETAKQSIQKAKQGSVILLLGNRYEEFDLTNKAVLEKTVVKPKTDRNLDINDTIDTVSNLQVNSILDGTYEMAEFNTARRLARKSEQFPLILIES
jgi:rhamnosyltransferase